MRRSNRSSPSFCVFCGEAADNIREFHERQKRNSFVISEREGVVIGQKVMPIERAGLYVPGGTAAYPSTVLMDAIPAKIAGCREVVITTPPSVVTAAFHRSFSRQHRSPE